jgi:hypothetical protein
VATDLNGRPCLQRVDKRAADRHRPGKVSLPSYF